MAAVEPAPVQRAALLDRLLASVEPVIAVVAPPGYGKTMLLAQWAERRRTKVAWVSCHQIHDDPSSLWAAVLAALTVTAVSSGPLTGFSADDAGHVIEHMAEMVGALTQPVTIVLDQLEAVSSPASERFVVALAMAIPVGSQLALASRHAMPFPEAQMRVEHRLFEIGTDDLAMSRAEASLLLSGAGVTVSPARTGRLVEQTEGWPAALYLAALAIQAGGGSAQARVHGRRPVDARLSPVRSPGPAAAGRAAVPPPHVDRGAAERAAVRRPGGWRRLDPTPGSAAAAEPPGDATRPLRRVVSLPPSVPPAATGRAPGRESGTHPGPARSGRHLVRDRG